MSLSMLYARWRQVAAEHGPRRALRDCVSGREWTFSELAALGEQAPPGTGVEQPTGATVAFVVSVLRAWRDGRPLCPLDHGQALSSTLPSLEPGVAHLKLTSATTGAPRLVAFTAAQLAADADQIVAAMGLRPEWPNVGVLSLAHSYGFSNLVLPLLLHGVPLLLAEGPLPEALRRATVEERALTLAGVPALWRTWHEAGAIPSTVRLAISAGAPLPVALEQAIHRERRLKVHNFYGATECGGIAYDASLEPRTEDGWVGWPMPGLDLRVAEDGCLEVRGRSVGLGYLPPDTVHLGHGRYHTRDLAEVGPQGVHLRGRASDLINVAGRKVAPETVEAVLASHPCVAGCVVFGAPDEDVTRHDRVVAVIAVRPAGEGRMEAATEATLRAHLLRQLAAWQVPRAWCWVEEIPVNGRGKVSRAAWRQRFLAGELSPVPLRTPRG